MILTGKEAASLLGVSVQTLRNWDESGYLKATRTAGGHRRYHTEDIDAFIDGDKKCYDVFYSWEGQHLEHVERLAQLEGEKDPRAKECGGFTKSQIGMLWRNQDTAHDEETRALNQDAEFFYELAASFSAPYLFNTRVMTHVNDLLTYRRVRGGQIVCESEDICASSHKEEYNWHVTGKELFKEIVNNIDSHCVQDVLNNSKKRTCSLEDIESTIASVIESIDTSTGTKEPKIVVYPPELYGTKRGVIRLTDNLKKLSDEYSEHNYSTFISRLVPENKILVGTNSKDKFGGYSFCPYMIMCQDEGRSEIMMRIGKKLLREGANHYREITVE